MSSTPLSQASRVAVSRSRVATFRRLPVAGQTEKVDQAAMQKIRDEGFNRSKIMEIASWLTDVYGPRLTGSPNTKKAGDWTIQAMKSWGITNPRYEQWPNFGHGWQVEGFTAQVVAPQAYPIIAYLDAVVDGHGRTEDRCEVVYARLTNEADLAQFRGKLRGKWVMLDTAQAADPHFAARRLPLRRRAAGGNDAHARRSSTAARPRAQQIARADSIKPFATRCKAWRSSTRGGWRARWARRRPRWVRRRVWPSSSSSHNSSSTKARSARCGAAPADTATERLPFRADARPERRPNDGVPNISVAAEHYGRMYRTIAKGYSGHARGERQSHVHAGHRELQHRG